MMRPNAATFPRARVTLRGRGAGPPPNPLLASGRKRRKALIAGSLLAVVFLCVTVLWAAARAAFSSSSLSSSSVLSPEADAGSPGAEAWTGRDAHVGFGTEKKITGSRPVQSVDAPPSRPPDGRGAQGTRLGGEWRGRSEELRRAPDAAVRIRDEDEFGDDIDDKRGKSGVKFDRPATNDSPSGVGGVGERTKENSGQGAGGVSIGIGEKSEKDSGDALDTPKPLPAEARKGSSEEAAAEDVAASSALERKHGRSNPVPPPGFAPPVMIDPVWRIGDSPDDAVYNRTYQDAVGVELSELRPIDDKIRRFFSPLCSYYRFNDTALPTVSVIVTTSNERQNLITLTIQSILGRTPPHLLREIILVDDNGDDPELREFVDEDEMERIANFHPKVKIVRNSVQEGCARSRMAGARAASGEVLMFVDSHVEMLSSTWYQHLVWPIVENPHTMAVQSIDVMSDEEGKNWEYRSGRSYHQYGIVSEKFFYGYQAKRFENIEAEQPGNREPYETPFVPGSLFAMRADEFWRLGGYDRGLYVWGGENTELAMKSWMCGGRVITVPCSRVGHVYRVKTVLRGKGQWPPRLDPKLLHKLGVDKPGKWRVHLATAENTTRVVTRNNIRIASLWMGDHPAKSEYYKKIFGTAELAPEWKQFEDELADDDAYQEQLERKRLNKCHDFEWFDAYVYKRLVGKHYPWHHSNPKMVQCGAHQAGSCRECPRGHGAAWCNGECAWCPDLGQDGECVDASDTKVCPSRNKKTVKKEGKEQRANDLELPVPLEDRSHGRKGLGRLHGVRGRSGGNASLWSPVEPADNPASLTLSVVLPCGFEHEFFIRTARSVYLSTPPSILHEIVIVDDASDPPLEPLFHTAFDQGDVQNGGPEGLTTEELTALKKKVKFVRNKEALGLIGAKQIGAEHANGDVLVFFDCHVKPDPDYWKSFTRLIGENYRRVVVPTITVLNTDTWEESDRPAISSGGGMSKCYLTFDAEFKWTTDDTSLVPVMSGGLLAMSRRWFFEVGGYDKEMRGWGGENLDQSLRIWRCGGEIVSAAESYVAHMWRDGKHAAKYKVDPSDAIRNRARAIKAHAGPWFNKTLTFPSFSQFQRDSGASLNVSSISDGMKDLSCKSFEWFLWRFQYIYRDAGVIPSKVFQLEAVLDDNEHKEDSPLCLQLQGHSQWSNAAAPSDVTKLGPCVDVKDARSEGTQWWHKSNRNEKGECCSGLRVWNTDQCLNSNGVTTSVCTLTDNHRAYLTKSGKLRVGGLCLNVEKGDTKLRSVQCDKAISWRKRTSFEPLEFSILSASMRSEWRKSGRMREPQELQGLTLEESAAKNSVIV